MIDRRTSAFTLIELLVGLSLGLLLWGVMMGMMRTQERMRVSLLTHLSCEQTTQSIHRRLGRDLGHAALEATGEFVTPSADGHRLRLVVQTGPAVVRTAQLSLPVETVYYQFLPQTGSLVRIARGSQENVGTGGLLDVRFVRKAGDEPGSRDAVVVQGRVAGSSITAARSFSLSFPFGRPRPGSVRWVSLLDPPKPEGIQVALAD